MSGSEVAQPAKKGITGTGIKIIAIVTMLIDHITAILLDNYYVLINTSNGSQSMNGITDTGLNTGDSSTRLLFLITILHMIGRLAFPLYIFLLVEGFQHTRSIRRYALNMLIFALISQLPYNLAHGGLLEFQHLNIFATLLMGILCMWCIKVLGEDRTWSHKLNFLYYITAILLGAYMMWLLLQNRSISLTMQATHEAKVVAYIVAGMIGLLIMIGVSRRLDADGKNRVTFTALPIMAFGVVSHLIKVEYGVYGVMAIVVMYLLRSSRVRGYVMTVATLTVFMLIEAAAFFSVPIVIRYNGKRGMKINKYFFYIFYPAHLLILYVIALVLGFTTFRLY